MDGRNVGGSNSNSSGRPKLVRSGISLQRENVPSYGTGPAKSSQDQQAKESEGTSIRKSDNASALGTGVSAPHSGPILNRPFISMSSASSKTPTLSAQKPITSVDLVKSTSSKVSIVEKVSEEAGSKVHTRPLESALTKLHTSAKAPTKPFTAGVSEGLSSLVSYSSSSAEASASEDNSQDDQEDLSMSSVSGKSTSDSNRSGNLGGESSKILIQKMTDIADLQKGMKVDSKEVVSAKDIDSSLSKTSGKPVEVKQIQPLASTYSSGSDSGKGKTLLEQQLLSPFVKGKVTLQREKESFLIRTQDKVAQPMEDRTQKDLSLNQRNNASEPGVTSQKIQVEKVKASIEPPKKEVRMEVQSVKEKTPVATFKQETVMSETKNYGVLGEKATPAIQNKVPTIQSKVPAIQSKVPTVQSKVPVVQSKAPVVQSKAPVVQSKAPVVQSNVPAVQSKVPAVQSKVPVVQSKAPVIGRRPSSELLMAELQSSKLSTEPKRGIPTQVLTGATAVNPSVSTVSTIEQQIRKPALVHPGVKTPTSTMPAEEQQLRKPVVPVGEVPVVKQSASITDMPTFVDTPKEMTQSLAVKESLPLVVSKESALMSVITESAQSSAVKEIVHSSAKEPKFEKAQNLLLDPIEEELKLLTEGHPLYDLGDINIEGGEATSEIIETMATESLLEKSDVLLKSDDKKEETECFSGASIKVDPHIDLGGDFLPGITSKELSFNTEKSKAVEEAAIQSAKVSLSDNRAPMAFRGADELSCVISGVERNVLESRSNSSASEEVKEMEVNVTPIAEQEDMEVELKSKKRLFGEESFSSADQITKEPIEKRMRLEEKDTSTLPLQCKNNEDVLAVAEMKTDKMEIGMGSAPMEGIPTFEKLSKDLEANEKLGLEDETKSEVDESQFRDANDSKDKDEEKEEEMATPSSRRRRKKKSYERPRGEGGKFRKEKPDPSLMDEETRMEGNLLQDEDSQGSVSKREVRRFRCEVIVPESTEAFTADKVVEYVWPLEGCGEHYFIQEQISQYLGIMSFKRKYPDLRRRPLEMQERDYLKDKGLVSEMACDLGLTAVRSEDVLDVMLSDFPVKFEELQRLLRERKENEIKERGKVNYSMATLDKSKMQEYLIKAAEDSARWNAVFNKDKRDERRYSFDLQTFTLQMPRGRHRKLPPELTKMGAYPVAVLPGQYTDFYRQYTPAALKSMPLNTVMSAPITNDQLGSDGGGSDSEEETSVPLPPAVDVPDSVEVKDEKTEGLPRCKVCSGTKNRNKGGKPEPLIICGSCRSASHPTCIDLTLVMVPKIESYNWQCMDCKSCVTCSDPDDEDKMIFCDMCDRGYHIYCVGLRRVPNGRWHCKECAICSSCGSKTPAGSENAKNAEWQHEFKKDKNNKQLRYATTLCVPCDKYWKRRQFCYVCLKVYRSIPEDGMVRCSNCPKYIHREGCSTMYENERFCNNCYKIRNSTALNHSRIIAAAKKKMASGY